MSLIDTAVQEDTLTFTTAAMTDVASRQGLIYRLRTDYGRSPWGYGLYGTDDGEYTIYTVQNVVDGLTSTRFMKEETSNWFQLDLGNFTTLAITGFSIRQSDLSGLRYFQSLKFEARVDNASPWVELWTGSVPNVGSEDWNDITGIGDGTYYKSFRVSLVGLDSSGTDYLCVSMIDLYGTFRFPDVWSYSGT